MKRPILFLSAILLSALALSAQTSVDTHTRIFDKSFKSLRACLEDNYYAPPIISLKGDDRIHISFDQLTPEMQYMRYTLVHCDASWQPSQILETEYVSGFNEANVDIYDYSSATFANYVHYEINVPNEDMQIYLSGNYLLRVYPEDNPDKTYLQVRFSVTENVVDILPSVTSRTDIDYNDSHQQLSFTVDTRDYYIENIYTDLKVVVTQNSRHDNEVMVSHPLRVSGREAVFEHDRDLIFKGANEFRRFEMVTTDYNGMGIKNYQYFDPYYHATLYTDETRADRPYSYDRTQYGRFTIRMSSAYDSNTEADYMIVHFCLDSPRLTGGNLYVDGEFTQHNYETSNRMHYNPDTGCYELDLMLKQGAYNYQYLWLPDGESVGKTAPIEGDFYQTVNEYQIRVYNRARGERYDRLIGYDIIYSGE